MHSHVGVECEEKGVTHRDLITVLRDLRPKPPPSSKYPKYMDIFYIQNQLAQHLFCQHLKYTAHTFLILAYYQVVITLDLSMNAD